LRNINVIYYTVLQDTHSDDIRDDNNNKDENTYCYNSTD